VRASDAGRLRAEERGEPLRERGALFDLRRVAAPVEDGKLGAGDQPRDLLGLVDRADPIVPSDRNQRRRGDPWLYAWTSVSSTPSLVSIA